jgi:hypothetical protein
MCGGGWLWKGIVRSPWSGALCTRHGNVGLPVVCGCRGEGWWEGSGGGCGGGVTIGARWHKIMYRTVARVGDMETSTRLDVQ